MDVKFIKFQESLKIRDTFSSSPPPNLIQQKYSKESAPNLICRKLAEIDDQMLS